MSFTVSNMIDAIQDRARGNAVSAWRHGGSADSAPLPHKVPVDTASSSSPASSELGLSVIIESLRTWLVDSFPNQHVDLTPRTNLASHYLCDSLRVVELSMFIEDTFGFEIGFDDLTDEVFETIGTLGEFVYARCQEEAAL